MKKFFILAIILVGIGGGLMYADSVGLINVFPNSGTNPANDFAESAVFPESIGSYVRAESLTGVRDECEDLANIVDSASKGLSGTVCTRVANAMYRDDATKKSVFVHLIKVTSGKETYTSYIKTFSRPDSISQYDAIRIEDHELGWFPQNTFDILLTQEGQLIPDSGGNMSMSYGRATGQNEVTQYFINKYPPAR